MPDDIEREYIQEHFGEGKQPITSDNQKPTNAEQQVCPDCNNTGFIKNCNNVACYCVSKSEQQDFCPLCGEEVLKQPIYDGWEWECQNIYCGATFILNRKLTEAEARARFRQRPESVEAKILERLKDHYRDNYNGCCSCLSCQNKQAALRTIAEIEKELKK